MTGRPATTSAGTITLDVTLLGRSYKVACQESERAELTEAVAFLERRLQEIRASGKVNGAERIAVMAALNLAHDLMRERATRATPPAPIVRSESIDATAARRRIVSMHAAIDQVLAGHERRP